MGPGETMFMLGIVGLLIGVLILTGGMFKRYLKFKERQLSLAADQTAEKAAQYGAHVERLEARVRVLERIITDKGLDLARQIDELRDAELPAPPRKLERSA